jgi:hypothetical protein
MRSTLLFLLLAGLGGPLSAQRERVVIVIPGQITRVVTDTMGTPIAYDAPPRLVFQALVKAYESLDVPVTLKDSVEGKVGNLKFHKSGRLGGQQISAFLSCGDGVTGPNADSYRVYMALRSVVVPSGENGSILRSTLFGGAMNVAEGARQAMPCESNGRFEILIGKLVQARLDAPF